MSKRKLRWCDYEVKESPEGIYFKDNTGQKPENERRLEKLEFAHQGEPCTIWRVRPCVALRLAWRTKNVLTYGNVLVLIDDVHGLVLDKDTQYLQPGDGIYIHRPGVSGWEPGLPDIVAESPTVWEFVESQQAVR